MADRVDMNVICGIRHADNSRYGVKEHCFWIALILTDATAIMEEVNGGVCCNHLRTFRHPHKSLMFQGTLLPRSNTVVPSSHFEPSNHDHVPDNDVKSLWG